MSSTFTGQSSRLSIFYVWLCRVHQWKYFCFNESSVVPVFRHLVSYITAPPDYSTHRTVAVLSTPLMSDVRPVTSPVWGFGHADTTQTHSQSWMRMSTCVLNCTRRNVLLWGLTTYHWANMSPITCPCVSVYHISSALHLLSFIIHVKGDCPPFEY